MNRLFYFMILHLFQLQHVAYTQGSFQLYGNIKWVKQPESVYLSYSEPCIGSTREKYCDTLKVKNGHFQKKGTLKNPSVVATLAWHSNGKLNSKIFLLDTGYNEFDFNMIKTRLQYRRKNSATDSLFQTLLKYELESHSKYDSISFKLISENRNNFYSLILVAQLAVFQHRNPQKLKEAFECLSSPLRNTDLGVETARFLENRNKLYKHQTLLPFCIDSVYSNNKQAFALASKYYLISFGATWCGPCKERIPRLMEFSKNYDSSKFQIVYINLDSSIIKWRKMINQFGIQHWINLTDKAPMHKSSYVDSLAITLIPFYILIDDNRRIIYNSMEESDLDLNKLAELLKQLSVKKSFTLLH